MVMKEIRLTLDNRYRQRDWALGGRLREESFLTLLIRRKKYILFFQIFVMVLIFSKIFHKLLSKTDSRNILAT